MVAEVVAEVVVAEVVVEVAEVGVAEVVAEVAEVEVVAEVVVEGAEVNRAQNSFFTLSELCRHAQWMKRYKLTVFLFEFSEKNPSVIACKIKYESYLEILMSS